MQKNQNKGPSSDATTDNGSNDVKEDMLEKGSVGSYSENSGCSDEDSATSMPDISESEGSDEVVIAASETLWVNRSKVLVSVVLLAACTLCAYFTYAFTTDTEQDNFENQVR
jgi:hypothetical protein